jgi:hypothetical protein
MTAASDASVCPYDWLSTVNSAVVGGVAVPAATAVLFGAHLSAREAKHGCFGARIRRTHHTCSNNRQQIELVALKLPVMMT